MLEFACVNGTLVGLSLASADLNGTIPDAISRLKTLTSLTFGNPTLIGTLPAVWSNLTNLAYFDLQTTQAQLPEEWSAMPLSQFYLTYPATLMPTVSLPTWLANSTSLTQFALTNANLGTFPSAMASLPSLQQLSLSNVAFSGSLPASLLTNNILNVLVILGSADSSSGAGSTLPSDWSGMTALTNLQLSYLGISGYLPSLMPPHLSSITIDHMPNLVGTIPSNFLGNEVVTFTMNTLFGLRGDMPVPTNITASKLVRYRLSHLGLDGTVPSTIFSFPAMTTFQVQNISKIRGSLPEQPWGLCPLLSSVAFTGSPSLAGTIPSSLFDCPRLAGVILDNNGLTGSLPASLANSSNLALFMTLSANNNSLTGTIPSINFVRKTLISIYLNNAGLTGTIPLSISTVTSWINFQLGGNNFDLCANANTTGQQTLSSRLSAMSRLCTVAPACVAYDCPGVWPSNCIPAVATNNTCPPPAEPITAPVPSPQAPEESPSSIPVTPTLAPGESPSSIPIAPTTPSPNTPIAPITPASTTPTQVITAPTPGTPNTFNPPSSATSIALSTALVGLAFAAILAL